jgi:GH24 family phage-related lysozyme (muramidase)
MPVQTKAAAQTAAANNTATGAREASAQRISAYPLETLFRGGSSTQQHPVQRRADGHGTGAGEMPPVGGSGQPLPAQVRSKMEGALGADFSAVRIHEGPRASSLGALAYTQGTDIHFAAGQYQPHSQRGQELLGHELTHVVQQSQGRVGATLQAKGVAINDDPTLEHEADQMGARAAESPGGEVAQAKCAACEAKERSGAHDGGGAIQRAPDPDSESKQTDPQDDRISADFTAAIMAQNLKFLAETDFSLDDARIQQIAPAKHKAARAAYDDLVTKQAAVKAPAPEVAGGAPDERWHDSKWSVIERQAGEAAATLAKDPAKSAAKSAVQAYAKAIAKYRAAKSALRDALKKLDVLDPEKGSLRACVKSPSEVKQPASVSNEFLEIVKHGSGKTSGEGFSPVPYKAAESDSPCTIGYGHKVHEVKCTPSPTRTVAIGGMTLAACDCEPPMVYDEAQATAVLRDDANRIHGAQIHQRVLVDLDQAHFDALVDLSMHVGHLPDSIVQSLHDAECTDDGAVRDKYLHTALGIQGHPEMGERFKARREERVWPQQAPQAPPQ